MAHDEGVIKFELRHRPAPPLLWSQLRELEAWRRQLWLARLIGQDPERYGGACYGNISRRLGPLERPPLRRRFAITGTQTGGLPVLEPRHYAVVEAIDPGRNTVFSCGPVFPSSESMTHGMLYALDPSLRGVMHVHSPAIWQQARALGLPATRPSVRYGTPDMAEEVARLFRETNVRDVGLFIMGGHEDGVIAFGASLEAAGRVLEAYHGGACRLTLCDYVFRALGSTEHVKRAHP